MAEIRWTLTAAMDLSDIETYIARDSPVYASRLTDRILEAVESLEALPTRGRRVPEFEREELREVIYRSYRVVYLLREDSVTILRVVHSARNLTSLVEREPWEIGD